MTFLKRFKGYVWGPYGEFLKHPHKYGGKLNSHIECEWTTREHWAHNNYQRGHLPQLCIKASGWKAQLLALLFWPPPPYESSHESPLKYVVWWKNGDHPNDDVWRPFEDTGKLPTEPREGKVVRYFRHPTVDGNSKCDTCGYTMNEHGWIDNGSDGVTICPGSYIRVKSKLDIK